MSTASTKRDRKKGRPQRPTPGGTPHPAAAADAARTTFGVGPAEAPAEPHDVGRRAWLVLSVAVLAAAALLRLYALGLKPMHHDEGVNGFFLEKLVLAGDYKYDPTNYHGPTLYFLTLPFNLVWGAVASVWAGAWSWDSVARLGLDDRALRLLTALSGVGTVALVLTLRRYLGAVGTLAAAALVALSPGAVYYSRYFIHETLFVFFTLAVVVAALRFYETGRASALWLAAAAAAMLFATKETTFISVITLGLAALVAWGWWRIRDEGRGAVGRAQGPPSAAPKAKGKRGRGREPEGAPAVFSTLRARFGDADQILFLVGTSAAVFVAVAALFYSSFFNNWKGVSDAVSALAVWKETGASDFHAKPFHTYLKWLWQEEAPILLLGAAGSAVALFERRRNLFAVFAGAWAFGLVLAYSLIPYKTPWLAINFVVPMALAGGYAVGALGRARAWRPAALLALLAALSVCGYQTVALNFRHFDDENYPYVYSHTRRETVELVRAVGRAAERAGAAQPGVAVASPEYWPLPWYFRGNPYVAYDREPKTYYDPRTTLAVVGRDDQLTQLNAATAGAYVRVGELFPLRPGVQLVLFVRRDLAGG